MSKNKSSETVLITTETAVAFLYDDGMLEIGPAGLERHSDANVVMTFDDYFGFRAAYLDAETHVEWEKAVKKAIVKSVATISTDPATGQTIHAETVVRPINASGAFRYFINLEDIDLRGFDTSACVDMSCLFCGSGCDTLTTLDLSGFDTSKCEDMSAMFSGCSSLTELELSGFDTSACKDMGAMFAGCERIEKLDLSGFDTSACEDMRSMFNGCKSLVELDVTGFDTSACLDMWRMFGHCVCIERLDISGFDASACDDMSGMFAGCKMLKEVHTSGANFSQYLKSWSMFNGCDSLAYQTENGKPMVIAEEMAVAFLYDDGMLEIGPSGLERRSDAGVVMTFDDYFGSKAADLKVWTHAEWDKTVKKVAVKTVPTACIDSATGQVNRIVKVIRPVTAAGAFQDFYDVESIDLQGLDTSACEDMSGMFAGCESLVELDLSGLDTSRCRRMRSMFMGCKSLTSLDVSGFDTSACGNMVHMFSGCESLTKLDLSGFDTSECPEMRHMFEGCKLLDQADISRVDTSSAWDVKIIANGGRVFVM